MCLTLNTIYTYYVYVYLLRICICIRICINVNWSVVDGGETKKKKSNLVRHFF